MEYEFYTGNIYKFLGVDAALKTLKNQRLRFASPTTFNDPLDGTKLIFKFLIAPPITQNTQRDTGNDENYKKYLKQYIDSRYGKDFSEIIFQRLWYETTKNLNLEKIKLGELSVNKELLRKIYVQELFEKEEIEKYKVCCFSKAYKSSKSFLMWSHYAESHFGICLCFKPSLEKNKSDHYNRPIKINYTSTLKTVDSKEEFDTDNWLFNKLNIWRYEQEVRIIRKSQKRQTKSLFKFQKEDLIRVIFGYNTTNQTILKVKEILSTDYDINVILFEKMIIDERSTKLTSKKYDINRMITL